MPKRKNTDVPPTPTKIPKITFHLINLVDDRKKNIDDDDSDCDDCTGNTNNTNNTNNSSHAPIIIDDDSCRNPLCDHQYSSVIDDIPHIDIVTIDDLITYGKYYHCINRREYMGINLRILFNLIEPLSELKKLIGMTKIKEAMVDQILFFLQKLNQKERCMNCIKCALNMSCLKQNIINDDMLHTIISGPPGVGKTELGKILGKVYKAMGILSKGHFNIARRSDLIAKYLGQTAAKTQDFINKCKGGVMFIDEAYSLGNPEGRDSFSKECLDTINQNLSEKRDFLCIIAGYEDALDTSFFSYNEGLKRRFSFKYSIEGYDYKELCQMFKLRVTNEGWCFEDNFNESKLEEFFKSSHKEFPKFGGDIETLFLKAKIMHSRRIIFKSVESRKKINMEDIERGFKNFSSHRSIKIDPMSDSAKLMYS
jgi:hypothetical protein